ncbi:pentapeptide repeat-containing protein [Streptomyces sp. NRRL B-24484]|uniref:pentapeptide repeat-containing protein n=1 Tax=Streptomyces sp. NRRL B-24484 TaxID=1463833 RepID=UPI000D136CAB
MKDLGNSGVVHRPRAGSVRAVRIVLPWGHERAPRDAPRPSPPVRLPHPPCRLGRAAVGGLPCSPTPAHHLLRAERSGPMAAVAAPGCRPPRRPRGPCRPPTPDGVRPRTSRMPTLRAEPPHPPRSDPPRSDLRRSDLRRSDLRRSDLRRSDLRRTLPRTPARAPVRDPTHRDTWGRQVAASWRSLAFPPLVGRDRPAASWVHDHS